MIGKKKKKEEEDFLLHVPLYVYYNGTDVSLLSCITDFQNMYEHIVHLIYFIS